MGRPVRTGPTEREAPRGRGNPSRGFARRSPQGWHLVSLSQFVYSCLSPYFSCGTLVDRVRQRESIFQLKTYFFFHDDHRDAIWSDLAVDDQYFVHTSAHVIELMHVHIFKRVAIFLNAPEAFIQVLDNLLGADHPNHFSCAGGIRRKLTTCVRGD